jgi:aminoglycoside 3-N-acetyltransferase
VSAIGAGKFEITKGHEFSSSPCDEKSPYYKNSIIGGYILFIGVAQESNTTIHMCEELAKVPYHLQKEVTNVTVTGYDGEKITVSNKLHDWEKPETDFNKLDELYRTNTIMKIGNVGKSTARLINAAKMLDFTVDLLRKEPLFLLV